ncbi:MAG TPA: hypothetical protein PKA63_06695 [Oligoflexia bacterium]|nr:hypothetical protein [Oligoflexia bacterium]HMP48338.1 hypothetical protein [Oligoflexia bacterium]
MKNVIVWLIIQVVIISLCVADEAYPETDKGAEGANSFEVGSDNNQSSIDSPSYPGEEIKLNSGKTVRRWSTRGPVPVSGPPQPFDQVENRRVPVVGPVILDVDSQNRVNRE